MEHPPQRKPYNWAVLDHNEVSCGDKTRTIFQFLEYIQIKPRGIDDLTADPNCCRGRGCSGAGTPVVVG